MMSAENKKPLMRSLGEFIGHIVHAIKSNPASNEVSRTVEEKTEGKITLRRTTVEEIEIESEDATRE